MIYLYLFGTCFHFIYVFMIIGNIFTFALLINTKLIKMKLNLKVKGERLCLYCIMRDNRN